MEDKATYSSICIYKCTSFVLRLTLLVFVSGSWLQFELQDLDPETERTRRRYSVSNSCLLPECVRVPSISWQLNADGTIEVSALVVENAQVFFVKHFSHVIVVCSCA